MSSVLGHPTSRQRRPAATPPLSTWAPLVVVAALGSLLVCGLADAAREHDGISTVDPRVAADMVAHRTAGLTVLARTLTFVGSEAVVGLIAAVILAALVWRRTWDRAVVFAVAMGGSAVLTVAVKLAVARPRPGAVDRLGALDTSYSFPSGHTLNSAVLLGLVCWLLWPAVSWTARVLVIASAVLLTAGIGFSRLYLGYHWFTDVTASVVIAVSWLSAVLVLSLFLPRLVPFLPAPQVSPGAPVRARQRTSSR